MDSTVEEQVLNNVGKPTHLAVSFDTTGSMSPCIADVRAKLKSLATQMFEDIPGLQMAIIAHGDYCDGDNVIRIMDFSADLDAIMTFLETTPNTGGGDAPECYEYVLNQARNLKWPEEGGSLMMIGDATPHGVDENPNKLDWEKELRLLISEKKVKVFSLQCMRQAHNTHENAFWGALAEVSGTPLLQMTDLRDTAENLTAIAYASSGEEAYAKYENRVKASGITLSADRASNTSKLASYSRDS